MEMNGGSSAPYLACTRCVPLFVHCLIRVEAEGLLDYQGRAGIISIVRWNLRPVIFGAEFSNLKCNDFEKNGTPKRVPSRSLKKSQKSPAVRLETSVGLF